MNSKSDALPREDQQGIFPFCASHGEEVLRKWVALEWNRSKADGTAVRSANRPGSQRVQHADAGKFVVTETSSPLSLETVSTPANAAKNPHPRQKKSTKKST